MSRAFLTLLALWSASPALAAQFFVCETDRSAPADAPAVAIAGNLKPLSGPVYGLGNDLYFQVGNYVAKNPLNKVAGFQFVEDFVLTLQLVDQSAQRAFLLDVALDDWSDLPGTMKGSVRDYKTNADIPVSCRAD